MSHHLPTVPPFQLKKKKNLKLKLRCVTIKIPNSSPSLLLLSLERQDCVLDEGREEKTRLFRELIDRVFAIQCHQVIWLY